MRLAWVAGAASQAIFFALQEGAGMTATPVTSEVRDQVGWITLNRPELHNAFDDEMIGALGDAFDELGQDEDVRVLVLAGAGKSFSAGADMHWMRRKKDYTTDENEDDAGELAALLKTIRDCPKPTLARVHGAAIGGGTGLVAACDIAVAVGRAVFAFSEVRLGLIPAVISPFVIERIGVTAARRYMLAADRFDAETAARIGLIAEVVEDEAALDERITELTEALLAGGPEALAACKELIADVAHTPLEDMLDDVARRIAELRVSEEGQEGLTAFLEKRTPNWGT
jgi:methylglutaconyl-CoA hydratase